MKNWTFWKENIHPKTPLCSQLVSSAKCFKPCGSMLDKRQKLVRQEEEELEARSQPWVAVPILPQRPSPSLPSRQGCCCVGPQNTQPFPAAGQQDREGRVTKGHITEGQGDTPRQEAVIHGPRTFWVTALGLTGTELCWGDLSHRQNFTLLY